MLALSPVTSFQLTLLVFFAGAYRRDTTKPLSVRYGGTATDLELPYYAKFMLVAAFLASHNPKVCPPFARTRVMVRGCWQVRLCFVNATSEFTQ